MSTLATSLFEVINSACSVLPKLDLPKFTRKSEVSVLMFRNVIINSNQTLSNFQKFQYLKAFVMGEVADIMLSLKLSNQNYQVVWSL